MKLNLLHLTKDDIAELDGSDVFRSLSAVNLNHIRQTEKIENEEEKIASIEDLSESMQSALLGMFMVCSPNSETLAMNLEGLAEDLLNHAAGLREDEKEEQDERVQILDCGHGAQIEIRNGELVSLTLPLAEDPN